MTDAGAARPAVRGWALGATAALALAVGVAATALSWRVAQHSLVGHRWRFVELLAAWVPLWLAGVWAARRLPTRVSLVLVVLVAGALRFAATTGPVPSISNDVYRYGWDAHVQLAGTDPYRYPPDARALVPLRDGFWPGPARCRRIGARPGCTELNRPSDRTIYPAGAEVYFDVVHLFNTDDAGARPWEVAGGLVDMGVVGLLVAGLRRRGRDPREVAWYALSPLPVVEFAGNGHVDGFALALLLVSLAALGRGRRTLAGVIVGAAVMVKLYPAVALVSGWRAGRRRYLVAAVATGALLELPHLLDVGPRILGYLPGYLKEEHYTSGSRFLLVGLTGLPGRLDTALAVAAVVVALAVVAWRRADPADGLTAILTVVILVTTPVQPWYAVGVGALGVLTGRARLAVLAAAGEVYYATVILADPHQVAVGRVVYGLAALTVILGGRVTRAVAGSGPQAEGAVAEIPAAGRAGITAGAAPEARARSRRARGTTGQSIPYGSPP